MFRRLLSVGGFTLLSRITGFVRDILMAAILGNGIAVGRLLRSPSCFPIIFARFSARAPSIPPSCRATPRCTPRAKVDAAAEFAEPDLLLADGGASS